MSFRTEVAALVGMEMRIEFRMRSGLQSVVLYTASTVFLCYWAIHKIDGPIWVALFWIILIFSSIQAAGRSFLQGSSSAHLYLYGMVSPQALLVAKMLFQAMVMGGLTMILLALYCLVLGFPVRLAALFLVAVFLGTLGISNSFTFLSAIASKASGSLTLLAILGVPVLLPILFVVIHFCISTLGTDVSWFNKDLGALVMMNLVIPAVACLIFPYVWRN